MKITIAMDSFKGSLSSLECGRAVAEGLHRALPEAILTVLPLADGGEGTSLALMSALNAETRSVPVTGPAGMTVKASYGIAASQKLAVMEMASAAGLSLVPECQRDPMHTTTYGVGEMICDAISLGCRDFIIGIGGSSTNDGGTGMLSAMGFRFLGRDGTPVPPGARGLEHLSCIDTGAVPDQIRECHFMVACDVGNPLYGENGCSVVYAPQKGADPESVEKMDSWMAKYAEITKQATGTDYSMFPGAGAAGGLGFAFKSFLNADLRSGVDIVLDVIKAESEILSSNLVITGEGRLDSQTPNGKAPIGITRVACSHGVPVVAIVGSASRDAGICNDCGITAFFPVIQSPCSLEEALDVQNAYFNVCITSEQVGRLISKFLIPQ